MKRTCLSVALVAMTTSPGLACDAISKLEGVKRGAEASVGEGERVHPRSHKPRPALAGRDPIEAAPSLVTVEGANIEVGSAESGGQRMFGLSCSSPSAKLMGGLAMVGVLAALKDDLDACAPKGGAAVVYWNATPGAEDIEVDGTDASTAMCVGAAMAKVTAPFSGACGVVLVFGEATGGLEALQGLFSKG